MLTALTTSHAVAGCLPHTGATPSSSAPAEEPPLYSMTDDVFTLDRDATLYYFFRGNLDGSAKAKYEIRYDRNLWNTCAQLQIRLPYVTRYPVAPDPHSPGANPYSGFGNAELRYSYSVVSTRFDHSLEAAAAFPTESNGVESDDTRLKFFYATKWRWNGGSVSYINEYDQTIVRPPGARYTSFYEGKLALPDYAFADSPAWRGIKISALYDYRLLFSNGGAYRSAIGAFIYGRIGDVALNIVDSFGIGPNGLWKYKVEASAVARF